MKSFNSLVSLLKKLSSEELKSLFKFINYYHKNDKVSKSQELINIILNEKSYNINKIQIQLYENINNYAFNKLIDRLYDKILEIIIFDTNINKNYYPDRVKVIFDLKKKLIQSDILSLKGLREDSDKLCRKIIAKAEKYELFDIVTSALAIRQRFINIRKNPKELKKIQTGIEIAERKNKNILESQLVFNFIINKINQTAEYKLYYDELLKAINKIEIFYGEFKLNIVNYYYLFLKTELSQINQNFKDADDCLNLILKLLKQKSIYSENRLGTTLLNIASNNIYLFKFNESIEYAKKAKAYFPNNIYNQALVNEYLFYSYFYKENYFEAEKIINDLIKLPVANISEFSLNKWQYLKACLLFIKKDFNACINLLNNIPEIDKDKEGWNINKRLMLIMCRIELEQIESVDFNISNLEKFIKRGVKKTDVKERFIYIIKILIKLINSDLNFKSVYNLRLKYFAYLESNDKDLQWKIKSPEIINFTKWYKSKI